MHQLAELSDEERRRLITDFIDEAFGGLDANPEFVAMMRSSGWSQHLPTASIRPARRLGRCSRN
jgi:hypothetical protein